MILSRKVESVVSLLLVVVSVSAARVLPRGRYVLSLIFLVKTRDLNVNRKLK